MASNTGVTITLIAGGITFTNQWYQTKKADWKVPVATVLLSAAVGGIAALDDKAATLLSLLILLGASTTQFNGKSFVDTITVLTRATGKNQAPIGKKMG